MRTTPLLLAALVGALGITGTAQASTFYFGDFATGGIAPPDVPASDIFATLDLVQDGSDVVFTLTYLVGSPFGDSSKLEGLWMNTTADATAMGAATYISGGVNIFMTNQGNDLPMGFGAGYVFDYAVDFRNSANDNLAPGESVTFSIANAQVENFIPVMGVHILGLPGGESVKYINAVPEAETWAMMLAGLGLVGFLSHRRRAAL